MTTRTIRMQEAAAALIITSSNGNVSIVPLSLYLYSLAATLGFEGGGWTTGGREREREQRGRIEKI